MSNDAIMYEYSCGLNTTTSELIWEALCIGPVECIE